MTSFRQKMLEFLEKGFSPEVERSIAIEKAYEEKFGDRDYGTEEYGLMPEQLLKMLERCIEEGKPFSDYVEPLNPDVTY